MGSTIIELFGCLLQRQNYGKPERVEYILLRHLKLKVMDKNTYEVHLSLLASVVSCLIVKFGVHP